MFVIATYAYSVRRTRAEPLCYFFYITVTYTNDHLLIIMYTFT